MSFWAGDRALQWEAVLWKKGVSGSRDFLLYGQSAENFFVRLAA